MNNYSYQSETSSKFNEESRAKIDALINAFDSMGWDSQKELSQEEIRVFLNNRAKENQFDQTLAQKIFSVLDVDDSNKITVEEFIKGYLQFEADLKKNNDDFNRKYIQEQENFNNYQEQCRLYKSENVNEEGFCENAKITVEITDVEIKKKLEGISCIIIRVIYNEETKEFRISGNNELIHEKFEFKPTSRRDRFEFIMKGINEHNKEFDIGSKRFPLNEVTSQEEYTVQITIPEIEHEDQVAAYINAKIVLYWSDLVFYENKKIKSEQKLKKLNDALNKTNQYLKKIKEIYGDLNSQESKFDFNNERNYGSEELNNEIYNKDNKNILRGKNDDEIKFNDRIEELNENPASPSTFKGGSSNNPNKYGSGGVTNLIKLVGLCCLGLGIIGSLKRPDFPNQVGGLSVILGCFQASKSEPKDAKNVFKSLLIGILTLLLYDFIWIINHITIINIDKYNGGHENFICIFSILACGINIIVKSFLSFLLYKQYDNASKLANQNYYSSDFP